MGWEESSSRARRLHRPSLRDWERDGLARSFGAYAEGVLGVDHRPYSCFTAGTGARTDKDGGTETEEWSIGREEAVRMGREDLRRRRREGAGGGGTGTGGATTTTTMCPVVLDASDLSPRDFKELYESSGVPVVIRGIPHGEIFAGRDGGGPMADDEEKKDDDEKRECRERLVARDADDGRGLRRRQDGDDPSSSSSPNNTTTTTTSAPGRRGRAWPAVRNWSIPSLLADPVLSDVRFKCGEDDDGRSVRMRLRHFLRYLERNRDDSPLYVFDATFDECRRSRRLLDDYDVPEYFDEDLLGLVGETRRPPYRWFLVGPERSGTTVHVDPLGTSAWNTVVHGVKRWALFPPRTSREAARGRGLVLRGEDDEAVHYFTVILPRIKRKAAAVAAATVALGGGDDGGGGGGGGGRRGDPYADLECYEFTQYPGETVYVPRGWWHAVLNVTHTVGVTQNYCSRRNFDDVWRATRGGRKKMACTWLRKLGEAHPDLARRARDLNDVDGHVMWEDDPEEQRRWRRKREERERRRKERGERGKRGEGAAVEEEDDDDEDRRKKSASNRGEERVGRMMRLTLGGGRRLSVMKEKIAFIFRLLNMYLN
ncbi:hypothetical protein ACHAW5_005667 [Stephanodiscus triporus]|uniref:JmjC domain-containing protein n=1 Tax=Stephanodiscus triporus TaxID=2934178 RepID=A0ABD3Q700_9STRA